MKVAGVVLEPTYIWHDGGTGGATNMAGDPIIADARPAEPGSRHTLGGRAVKKFAAGSARVDVTVEGYYQFGEIGMGGSTEAGLKEHGYRGLCLPYRRWSDPACAYAAPSERRATTRPPVIRMTAIVNGEASINCTPPTTFTSGTWTTHVLEEHEPSCVRSSTAAQCKDSHFEVTGHLFKLSRMTTDDWYRCRANTPLAFADIAIAPPLTK